MEINYSIIIPHYNSLDTLPRTINSIPARDDVEVLVVDNSPVPVKREQIEGVSRDFTLLYSDKTKGAGHARNVGIDHAQGRWLVFADADDFFTDGLNAVLDKYRDTDWDVVMFPIKTVDSVTLEPNNRTRFYNEMIFDNDVSDRRKLSKNITPWSKLVSHRLVKEHGIRYGETKVSNDVVFNAYVAVLSDKILIDKQHSIYVLTYKEGSLISKQNDENLFTRACVDIQRNKIYKEYGHGEWYRNYFPYDYISRSSSAEHFLRYVKLLHDNRLVFSGSFKTICRKLHFLFVTFFRIAVLRKPIETKLGF